MAVKKYRSLLAWDDQILVSEDIPIDLEINLLAALTAYLLGQKSVDLLLKQYGEQWRSQIEKARNIPSTD